jgi:hypothetical protein
MNANKILTIVGVVMSLLMTIVVMAAIFFIWAFRQAAGVIDTIEDDTIKVLRKIDSISLLGAHFSQRIDHLAVSLTAIIRFFIDKTDELVKFADGMVKKLKPVIEGTMKFLRFLHI